METMMIIILILASVSSSAPLNVCSTNHCYMSDGFAYNILSMKQAQNCCTALDNSSRLLETYDQHGWSFINNSLTGLPTNTCILLNTMGDDYPAWTTILGNPLQADYPVNNNVSVVFAYLSKLGGSLLLYGGDNTANRPFVCMYSDPCHKLQNGYNISDKCYIIQMNQVTWFDAETLCYNDNGHLASFENVPFTDLAASDLVSAMTTTDEYWVGISKFNYRWLTSNTTVYFSAWDAGYPLYNPHSSAFTYFVYFQIGRSLNRWLELPVASPINSFQVICMKDVQKTYAQSSAGTFCTSTTPQTTFSATSSTGATPSILNTTLSTATLKVAASPTSLSSRTPSTTIITKAPSLSYAFTSARSNEMTPIITDTSDFNNSMCILIIFLMIIYLIFAIIFSIAMSYYVYS